MNAPDPAKIVKRAIEVGVSWTDSQLADAILLSLREAGWHLVRQDRCADPTAELGQCGCATITVTHEWVPQIAAAGAMGEGPLHPSRPACSDGSAGGG